MRRAGLAPPLRQTPMEAPGADPGATPRHWLSRAWQRFLAPLLSRPDLLQVAALCTREAGKKTEILLVTSRGAGRWILPKGWPMPDRSLAEAAAQEAWEEAGVCGSVDPASIGSYSARKRSDGGVEMACRVHVFRLHVASLSDTYPEAGQRRRRWVSPAQAAELVQEPQLRRLLEGL